MGFRHDDDREDSGRDRPRRSSGGFGRGGGRGGFGGRDRERRPLEMHEVTCDKCGKQCEVPFKPTGDKPVYCRDCFDKTDSGSSRGRDFGGSRGGSSGISAAEIEKINEKLDKIMKALEID